MLFSKQDKIGRPNSLLRSNNPNHLRPHQIRLHNLHQHLNHPGHLCPMVFDFNPLPNHRTTRRRRRKGSRKHLKRLLPPQLSSALMGHKHLRPLPRRLINLLTLIRQPLQPDLHPHHPMYNLPFRSPFIQLYNQFRTLRYVHLRLRNRQHHGIPSHHALLLRHLFLRTKRNLYLNLSPKHHMYLPLHKPPSHYQPCKVFHLSKSVSSLSLSSSPLGTEHRNQRPRLSQPWLLICFKAKISRPTNICRCMRSIEIYNNNSNNNAFNRKKWADERPRRRAWQVQHSSHMLHFHLQTRRQVLSPSWPRLSQGLLCPLMHLSLRKLHRRWLSSRRHHNSSRLWLVHLRNSLPRPMVNTLAMDNSICAR